MKNNLIKFINASLCILLFFSMHGCFSAENIASNNPETLPSAPINLYSSREINRYIQSGEVRSWVVDQYGNMASDCSLDNEGNILLNGKLIVPAEDTEKFSLPSQLLLADTSVNLLIGEPFDPEAFFVPNNTSCREFKVEVIEGEHQINDDGKVFFTALGPAICKVYSVLDPNINDICYINVYNSPEEFSKPIGEFQKLGEIYAGDYFATNKDIYLNWLDEHQSDNYYLGTPYDGNDARRPNGDTPEGETPGLNCTGFVWHALYKATELSFGNADAIPGMVGWSSFYRTKNICRYSFSSKEDMLASGVLEKGDIIWIWDANGENGRSDTHHIGIYLGDGHSDIWWHSLNGLDNGFPANGNMISHIGSNVEPYRFVVIDMYK